MYGVGSDGMIAVYLTAGKPGVRSKVYSGRAFGPAQRHKRKTQLASSGKRRGQLPLSFQR
jgi:hypothetical protein